MISWTINVHKKFYESLASSKNLTENRFLHLDKKFSTFIRIFCQDVHENLTKSSFMIHLDNIEVNFYYIFIENSENYSNFVCLIEINLMRNLSFDENLANLRNLATIFCHTFVKIRRRIDYKFRNIFLWKIHKNMQKSFSCKSSRFSKFPEFFPNINKIFSHFDKNSAN